MRLQDRQAHKNWQSYFRTFRKGQEIDYSETGPQKDARIKMLLGDFEKFAKYYFPKVCKAEFAKWHKKYVKYVVENDECFAVVKVSRDMAKSSVTAMLVVFLYLKGEIKSLGMFSHIQDQAEMLLSPIKTALEKNEAIIRDFGNRKGSLWTSKKFTTSDDCSFRAIGAGQNPRGEKNEDADRFDTLIFDDFDDPEVCRNPERLDNHWDYVTGDCFPALHVSGRKRIMFLNNKIAEDCIVERAFDHAKSNFDNPLCITVNLVDKDGHSNWPEAYTDEQCKKMIDLVGDSADTEYMNNPSSKGKQFKKEWFQFKKLPNLNSYKLMVAYLDGGFKKTKTSDTKALILIGMMKGEYHIHKVYVDNVSIATMIAWHYDLFAHLKKKNATCIWYMEEVFLLGLLHEHFDKAVEQYGFRIPMLGDKRKKPDKDLRISNTAGLYERGFVFFDESLKDCRYTKRLINQYMRFKTGIKNLEKDGPDAVEGGMHLLRELLSIASQDIKLGERHRTNKRI